MKYSRRQFALLTAGLGVGLASCTKSTGAPSSSAGSSASAKYTIGLTYTPNIQFAPMYVAAEKGFFTEQGLNITLRHHGAQESLLGALQSGDEQVVYAGGDEMMQARSQGVDAVSIATIYQQHPVELIVPEASAIKTLADLQGHSVGLPGPYGENWFGLLAMLNLAGLKQSDISIQNIGYTQQSALMGGRVDSVIGFSNNDAVQFRRANFAIREIQLTSTGALPLVGVGLGALNSTVNATPGDLTKLLRAVRTGMQFNIDNPDESVRLSAKYVPGLTDSTQAANALATLKATNTLYGTLAQFCRQNESRWTQMAAFMQDQGLLAKPVPAAEAYTTKIVQPLVG